MSAEKVEKMADASGAGKKIGKIHPAMNTEMLQARAGRAEEGAEIHRISIKKSNTNVSRVLKYVNTI